MTAGAKIAKAQEKARVYADSVDPSEVVTCKKCGGWHCAVATEDGVECFACGKFYGGPSHPDGMDFRTDDPAIIEARAMYC